MSKDIPQVWPGLLCSEQTLVDILSSIFQGYIQLSRIMLLQ